MTEIDVNLGGPLPCPTDARKRVRFSDVDLLATYHLHDDASSTASSHDETFPYALIPGQKNFKIRERRSQASLASDFRGRYLSIQPGDELVFERKKNPELESSDVIRLVNIASGYVAFKVKTTAPEKYRVRPSFGCIESGGSKIVEVTVQPGFPLTPHRDRFLVMSVPLKEEPKDHDDLVEYWRELLKDGILHAEVEEHRLHSTVVAAHVDVFPKSPQSAAEPVLNQLILIDSKLDYLIATKKSAVMARRKMHWNLLTLAFAVVLLFFTSRVFMFIFSADAKKSIAVPPPPQTTPVASFFDPAEHMDTL
ncbi:hypothetical protein BV898_02518 [Hypsibius exemplaris]|uniref:MSP domain-containing protein n=1 Tax=Hypsibius exemplaris TaxID=2072580 RepID=A0A1W0X8H4_HYPEX|nr:hypothetical protein BV898_02518 [Hypsibius exemplaris]